MKIKRYSVEIEEQEHAADFVIYLTMYSMLCAVPAQVESG